MTASLSFWEKDYYTRPVDILIAGAGFSGLWLAYFLKKEQPNLTIRVIDKHPLPSGASTKNAGFACFGSPSELAANSQTMGQAAALAWASTRLKGIRLIAEHFGNHIDYEACGGYEVYETAAAWQQQVATSELLNSYFRESLKLQENVYRDASAELQSFGFKGFRYAILNTYEGAIHSVKLWAALKHRIEQMGVQVALGVALEGFAETAGRVTAQTSCGEMKAAKLCLTLNSFINQLLPDFDSRPGRGQVLITSPIEGLPFRGTFHFKEGYYYFRHVGNRVLLGGGRELAIAAETTHELATTPLIQETLERYLQENIVPNRTFKIEQRWAGIMAFDDTKTPLAYWHTPRVGICGRFNGMGVALAPALAQQFAKEF